MDPWVIDLCKQLPAIAAIVGIVQMGMAWHERISKQWLIGIEKIDERHERMSQSWLGAIKEIGEKCHEAHSKIASMYYEQSCHAQQVATQLHSTMGQIGVHMDHFARAQEAMTRAIAERKA